MARTAMSRPGRSRACGVSIAAFNAGPAANAARFELASFHEAETAAQRHVGEDLVRPDGQSTVSFSMRWL